MIRRAPDPTLPGAVAGPIELWEEQSGDHGYEGDCPEKPVAGIFVCAGEMQPA
jgi:hypothetical protein